MNIFGKNLNNKIKTPAANERFCEMAGATRPKFCLTLQRQWLVRAAVKPATSQSRHHVGRNMCACLANGKRLKASSGSDYREMVTRKLAVLTPYVEGRTFVPNSDGDAENRLE